MADGSSPLLKRPHPSPWRQPWATPCRKHPATKPRSHNGIGGASARAIVYALGTPRRRRVSLLGKERVRETGGHACHVSWAVHAVVRLRAMRGQARRPRALAAFEGHTSHVIDGPASSAVAYRPNRRPSPQPGRFDCPHMDSTPPWVPWGKACLREGPLSGAEPINVAVYRRCGERAESAGEVHPAAQLLSNSP
ncbi:hypothetical protein BKA66DRAFT_461308 [Pyrenochaeta sp. MPI-SDFR-AT-0127]|nr:hypothetical protein BKA66DRAFT_461308 [Pyrenochaeta sp. MPI-SDFR-AT-0127]